MLAAVCLAIALVLGALYASEKTRRIAAEKQCTVSASTDSPAAFGAERAGALPEGRFSLM